MQPGQTLVNKDGEKRKILGVCGKVVFISQKNRYNFSDNVVWTKEELETDGWSLLEEPWVPKPFESYFFVDEAGDVRQTVHRPDLSKCEFRFLTGNFQKTYQEAELYKQKLIERMGSKS